MVESNVQSTHQAETRRILTEFGISNFEAANEMIEQTNELNWTTLLVSACEVRQAKVKYPLDVIIDLAENILSSDARMSIARDVAQEVVAGGSTTRW